MRYIFVSDIHGRFDKLTEALKSVAFDKEKDTLVSVGDAFDRGEQCKEVLEFLMSCPNRILMWGNHDYRLRELIYRQDRIAPYDISNGVPATIESIAGIDTFDFYTGLHLLSENKLLNKYFLECIYALEFKDLIVTHAWLPITEEYKKLIGPVKYKICPDWRKWDYKYRDIWYEALWAHTQRMVLNDVYPEKTLLIGHWHAWRLAELSGEDRRHYTYEDPYGNDKIVLHLDCKMFKYEDKFIAIDGCSNYEYGGCVNAYVYETDEKPIIYDLITH